MDSFICKNLNLDNFCQRGGGRGPPPLLQAAKAIASWHATTLGSVLAALLVPVLSSELPERLSKGNGFKEAHIEAPQLGRIHGYKKLIAQGPTLLVVPTIIEAKSLAKELKAYAPLVITSALSPKKREEALQSAPHWDGLVITTPSFSFVPIIKLRHIIIERVSAGSYALPKRPYIDVRTALIELAKARSIFITLGDYPLPLEYRPKPDAVLKEVPSAKIKVIDAREAIGENEKWSALPNVVQEAIQKILDKKGVVAVLAVRRGYAPSVVCRDCGTTVTDEYGRTLSFSMEKGERVFRSAGGETVQSAKVFCKHCGSWNLLPLGVGVERVAEELAKAFPGIPLVRVDADSLSSKTAREIATSSEGGKIIVGTELMIPYLSPGAPISLAVVASADSLLALPFWRARERFVRVGLMLAERSEKLLVVTRKPDDISLTAIANSASSEFWKEETRLRKLLHYPPYGTLIVFHAEGSLARIRETQKDIAEASAPHTLLTLAERHISQNQYRGTSVLHLPNNEWPDGALSERLSQLPPFVRVHIDSETFW
jgi:primosomal protein N' (replication factor Y)